MQKLKQVDFFQLIEQKNKGLNLVDVLMDLLNLSKGQTYRRINGQTMLSFEDIQILATHFQISLDDFLLSKKDTIQFQFPPIHQPAFSAISYLNQLDQELKCVQKNPNNRLLYATNEFPIFYTFLFPELIQFKMYMWERTFWEQPNGPQNIFRFGKVSDQILELAQSISQRYLSLPSEEYWNIRITDNTVRQINYALESGLFDNLADALLLCEQLKKVLTHMELMAKKGQKFLPQKREQPNAPTFHLYLNDLPTNILLLVTSPEESYLYTTFDNPNFMKSTHPEICNYTIQWFKKLQEKSILLSGSAERSRRQFFKKMEGEIIAIEKKIQSEL